MVILLWLLRFGQAKQRWLRKFLRLRNGIPSHDTFRRVFSLIDSASLQQATVSFLLENMDAMHTQKETLSEITAQKGNYVGGLKGNQGGLLEAVNSAFTQKKKEAIKENMYIPLKNWSH